MNNNDSVSLSRLRWFARIVAVSVLLSLFTINVFIAIGIWRLLQ
ncbi:MAG: hypothetical protein ACPGFA_11095 [Pikeienuella sp.]